MIKIEAIPAFSDNYIWCLYDDHNKRAVVVDPGDARPVLEALSKKQLTLDAIIITHHHFDHTGGISELIASSNIPVYGPDNPQIAHITHPLSEQDQVDILGISFTVMTIPGHTLDHIAFYSTGLPPNPILFCGDTLFAGGCGRVFEGNPAMMLGSLNKLASLPPDTVFYCAHEYTLANLKFALAVEPNNDSLKARINSDTQRRKQGLATVPSTLAIEKETNPFLRCEQPSVISAANRHNNNHNTTAANVFTVIRDWKDNF